MQTGDPNGWKLLMEYRRLRAPREHGATLELPPLSSVEKIWRSNLDHIQTLGQIWIGDVDLGSLQESGRREVIELARRYTGDYLDVDLSGRTAERIVVSSGRMVQEFRTFNNWPATQLRRDQSGGRQ